MQQYNDPIHSAPHLISTGALRRDEAASNLDPFRDATALLALDVDNVRVATTPASYAVLLLRVPLGPVLVLLAAGLVVQRRLLEEGLARELARRRVGGTVLDRGVPVAKVAEVVDLGG